MPNYAKTQLQLIHAFASFTERLSYFVTIVLY